MRTRAWTRTIASGSLAAALALIFAAQAARAHGRAADALSTVRVKSMTVNGLKVKDLRCTLKSGGLFASAAVVGALAKQKKALRACAKGKKARPRVRWRFSGGRATSIEASGKRKAVAACVKRAFRRVRAKVSGRCAATLVLP